MKLSIDGEGPLSSTDKAEKYQFFHPTTFRRHTVWFPKSLVQNLGRGLISIPDWFWQKWKDNNT